MQRLDWHSCFLETATMSELVAYSLEDGIATLTLNNGKVKGRAVLIP